MKIQDIYTNLAIKGHKTRGDEVIKLLEMLGGKNNRCLNGTATRLYYFIENNEIWGCEETPCNYIIFTLEEFLEKYPYKIGDKVNYIIDKQQKSFPPYMDYDIRTEIKEPIKKINLDIPEGYEFFGVDNNKVILIPKQPPYPKSYEECCDVLELDNDERHINVYMTNIETLENKMFEAFIRLIRCRNAYWRIAGKELGLEKPWEPDWNDTSQIKHSIWFDNNGICIKSNRISYAVQHILTFPTSEIREIFYENFKDLIEKCKELL